MALDAKSKGEALSIGVVCNAVDLLQALIDQDIIPDTLTDQTSAHDPLVGYFPQNMSVEEANELRKNNPDLYVEKSLDTMAKTCQTNAGITEKR